MCIIRLLCDETFSLHTVQNVEAISERNGDRVVESLANPPGGYRYLSGIPPYSAGVRADDDHVIMRSIVSERMPWSDGFSLVDAVLAEAGRPSQALCALELRCPRAHSFDGFGSFNDDYRQALDQRGILLDGGINPVARTNVAPAMPGLEAASDTELYAFSFTMPRSAAPTGATARPSFVIAGAGDLSDQSDLRPEAIVGGGQDWQASGEDRARAVLDEMEARLQALDVTWGETDAVVTYSVERIGAVIESTVLPRLGSAKQRGVHWIHARPPIEGLRFEMDTRGGTIEQRR